MQDDFELHPPESGCSLTVGMSISLQSEEERRRGRIEMSDDAVPDFYYDFAFVFVPDELARLADLAEPENWQSADMPDNDYAVLYQYLKYTYDRAYRENKIVYSEDGEACCFNTGLVTELQQEIYAYFLKNTTPDKQQWDLEKWILPTNVETRKFKTRPELVNYHEDPGCLVFDHRLPIDKSTDHIVLENRERWPDELRTRSDWDILNSLDGAIENARRRIRRNYKTAVPQFHRGRIQLLIPLCFTDPSKVDLALVVERVEDRYIASTILTLPMAYRNARLLAKPDQAWLSQ